MHWTPCHLIWNVVAFLVSQGDCNSSCNPSHSNCPAQGRGGQCPCYDLHYQPIWILIHTKVHHQALHQQTLHVPLQLCHNLTLSVSIAMAHITYVIILQPPKLIGAAFGMLTVACNTNLSSRNSQYHYYHTDYYSFVMWSHCRDCNFSRNPYHDHYANHGRRGRTSSPWSTPLTNPNPNQCWGPPPGITLRNLHELLYPYHNMRFSVLIALAHII